MSFPFDTPELQATSVACNRPQGNPAVHNTSTSIQSSRYRNLPIDPSIPLIPIGNFLSTPHRPGRNFHNKSTDSYLSMSEQTARSSNNKAQGRNDSNRPGRRVRKHPLDPDPTKSFGDPIIQKSTDTFRFFFQNVKGLTPSVGSEDYRYYLNSLSSLQVDIAGLAETNTCWQHSHLCDDFRNAARRFYRQSKVIFGSPDTTVDPVPFRETFQSGGTVTLVSGQLVSRIHGSAIEDMSGLGRWTGVTLSGSASQKLSIITAYRVCSGSIRSAPLGSAFAREFEFFHKLSKEKSVNPR